MEERAGVTRLPGLLELSLPSPRFESEQFA
jgi:hypothetical protein